MTPDLPPGWTWATLGEIGRYHNGRAFKSTDWGEVGRPIIRIQNLTGSGSKYNHFRGQVDPRHVVNHGELLVSWAATLGVFVWRGPEAILNQHIFKVESHISPRFHRWLLESVVTDLYRQAHGSGMVHITKKKFELTPVRLPPAAEQERIVAAIEEHFSRLDAVDAGLASAVLRTTRLLQRAVDDQLRLVDARGQLLSELLTESLANGRSVPTASSGGDPVLRLTAIKEGFIDPAETKQGDFGDTDPNRFAIARDDFLISRGNGSLRLVGRGGLVSKGAPPVAFPDTMIRARVDESRLSPRYLSLVWHSRKVRRQLESQARTTAGIYKVNQSMIGAIELPVPPLDIQRQLVRVVDEAGYAVASCVDSLDRCQAKAAALRRSILSRAFSGELVPKSPRAMSQPQI